MTTNTDNSNKLKDFDFDNIFDEKKKDEKEEQSSPTLFESFRNTKASTNQNNQTLNSNILQNVDLENRENVNSLPGSTIKFGNNPNKVNVLARTSLQINQKQLNNNVFDDFNFTKKNENTDVFDLQSNSTPKAFQTEQNTKGNEDVNDIDLMGLDLGNNILNQDIHNLDQNLFKKENPSTNQFTSNNPNNTNQNVVETICLI